ncbi:Na+/H+ antiporter NhaC family protein [Cereibacter sp. SYSU M97828]|nr:Na+/H+ antiporter NhaC family protein [Cereibacter flavus]
MTDIPLNPAADDGGYRRKRVLPVLALFAAIYAGSLALDLHINAVVLSIVVMVTLCLLRLPVAVALVSAAVIGGLQAGLPMTDTLAAFNENLLIGSQVGLTYIMVGAFAVALARSGLLELLAQKISGRLDADEAATHRGVRWSLLLILCAASVMSQNVIPVHIAFIPVLIPPLLGVLNRLRMDRRAIACVLACAISSSYLLLPTGFGAIFLNDILLTNLNEVGADLGFSATPDMAPKAMFLPVMGIVAGMLVAVFVTYRKPRDYRTVEAQQAKPAVTLDFAQLAATVAALVAALVCQLQFDSLLIGAMVGFVILGFAGIFRWREQDDVFTEGLRMMAQVAMIITIASGFAGVLTATGEVQPLVAASAAFIGDNKALGAAIMLIVGLFITIGFGDSFASVPILAPIYLPLALALDFSPLAAVALLGASAALGDAGSPASTITLGATAGLNADGQHDHMKDSVIPTFFHANFGMVLFAWIAALTL